MEAHNFKVNGRTAQTFDHYIEEEEDALAPMSCGDIASGDD